MSAGLASPSSSTDGASAREQLIVSFASRVYHDEACKIVHDALSTLAIAPEADSGAAASRTAGVVDARTGGSSSAAGAGAGAGVVRQDAAGASVAAAAEHMPTAPSRRAWWTVVRRPRVSDRPSDFALLTLRLTHPLQRTRALRALRRHPAVRAFAPERRYELPSQQSPERGAEGPSVATAGNRTCGVPAHDPMSECGGRCVGIAYRCGLSMCQRCASAPGCERMSPAFSR